MGNHTLKQEELVFLMSLHDPISGEGQLDQASTGALKLWFSHQMEPVSDLYSYENTGGFGKKS